MQNEGSHDDIINELESFLVINFGANFSQEFNQDDEHTDLSVKVNQILMLFNHCLLVREGASNIS